jgi:hypothetical protein
MAGDRPAAAAADRLGHRATEDAVSDITPQSLTEKAASIFGLFLIT